METRLLGEMTSSRMGQGKYKMSLECVIVLESKETFKA